MNVAVRLAPIAQRYIFANMWIAYAHEISQYQDDLPSVHGMMGDIDEDYEPDSVMAEWWAHPGKTFPYLITVDERPAGFALVAKTPLIDGDADQELVDFFLFHPYRGKGIGRDSAIRVLYSLHGSWQLSVIDSHESALGFWSAVLGGYAKSMIRTKKTHKSGLRLTEFTFENSPV